MVTPPTNTHDVEDNSFYMVLLQEELLFDPSSGEGVWCLHQKPSFWSNDMKDLMHNLKEDVSSLCGRRAAF